MSNIEETVNREKLFYDDYWSTIGPHKVHGFLSIPGVQSLNDSKILICSCGRGVEPVLAANAGANVFTFDISPVAVENTKIMAKENNVDIVAEVMNFHELQYPDNFFDYMYGAGILHHVDCQAVGKEIYRVLKPGGVAFFWENSDRNAILRFFRRILFGSPGRYQKRKSLIFKRRGTHDEYPLTEEEVNNLSAIFSGNLMRVYGDFVFFSIISYVLEDIQIIKKSTEAIDRLLYLFLPFLLKYSYVQGIRLQKQI